MQIHDRVLCGGVPVVGYKSWMAYHREETQGVNKETQYLHKGISSTK